MNNRMVPVLLDSACAHSEWHREIYQGIQKAASASQRSAELMEHAQEAVQPGFPDPVILIGFSRNNLQAEARLLTNQGKRVILAGVDTDSLSSQISCVTHSRSRQTIQLIQYLYSCGKKRLAMVGIGRSSLNDLVKVDAALRFTQSAPCPISRKDVFDWADNLESCLNAFLPVCGQYDGVICPNDYAALSLIRVLNAKGVSVPGELYVASFANQAIGRYCVPSITSITMDFTAIGRYAFAIWQQLQTLTEKNLVCKIFAPSRLIVRESTAFQNTTPEAEAGNLWNGEEQDLFYNDPSIRRLMHVESCLNARDELDMRIIDGVLKGESYEALSDRLFIGHSPLHYRLTKIYRDAGCRTRAEFERLFSSSYGAFRLPEEG